MDLDRCRKILEQDFRTRPKRQLPLGDLTAAAVLVPFYKKKNVTHLLFVKRTNTVRHHKGQISFPGGARDSDDQDLLETALRETEEEIGLGRSMIRPFAEMDDMITPTRFRVTPFAAEIEYPAKLNINPHETDSVLEIPLAHLLDQKNHRLGYRRWKDVTYEVHYFDYGEVSVWGVTGLIVHDFLDRLRSGAQL